jgi:hypothetical protein
MITEAVRILVRICRIILSTDLKVHYLPTHHADIGRLQLSCGDWQIIIQTSSEKLVLLMEPVISCVISRVINIPQLEVAMIINNCEVPTGTLEREGNINIIHTLSLFLKVLQST